MSATPESAIAIEMAEGLLTAEDGIRAHDTIVLEPEVYGALTAYVARLRASPTVGPAPSDGEARAPQGASNPEAQP